MYLFREFSLLPVLILAVLWVVGGWLISARLFDLKPVERHMLGFGLGLTLSNWLANLLARALPLELAFWLSALSVLAFGIFLAWPIRKDLRALLSFSWGQWLAFALLAFLFTLIDRGLGIFDDHQNLPIVSIMATGDIPPHFPLAREVILGYHYFLLLLATQFMRVGHAAPWVASDLAHGVTMAVTFLLAGLFAARLTDKPLAQFWGAFFAAFEGGTRWLLLLLPPSLLAAISNDVRLIGSTAQNATDLQSALNGPWLADGSGPVPFPFAFVSGIHNPGIMSLSGYGLFPLLILLVLILAGPRIKDRFAWPFLSMLLASLALANEVTFALLCAGFFLVILIWMIQNRSPRLPASLRNWLAVFFVGGVVALLQGGVLTEAASGLLFRTSTAQPSYYEIGFHLVWPPNLLSSHLGELSLFDPLQLLAALVEIGPVFLVFPLVFLRGRNEFKSGNWIEAGFIFSSLVSLLMVFFEYSGTAGPTATTRLYSMFFGVCALYAVPLGWLYLERRGTALQGLGLTLSLTCIISGVVLFSVQLYAVSHPMASYYLTELDVQVYEKYWDRLPARAMVFDPVTGRSVTLFGRATDANLTFYREKPEYLSLMKSPDPYAVHAAGYDYMYYNIYYWQDHKDFLDSSCARVVDQFTDIHQATGESGDFRRLVDIRDCTR